MGPDCLGIPDCKVQTLRMSLKLFGAINLIRSAKPILGDHSGILRYDLLSISCYRTYILSPKMRPECVHFNFLLSVNLTKL